MVWGALSALLLVQIFASLIILFIFLASLAFSEVAKSLNAIGLATSVAQVLLFGVLLAGGIGPSGFILVNYSPLSLVAALLSFLATIAYCAPQIPGKLLLARMCAWRPYFTEASMALPRNERVAFARRYKAQSRAGPPRRTKR